jgi:hypothetical protein
LVAQGEFSGTEIEPGAQILSQKTLATFQALKCNGSASIAQMNGTFQDDNNPVDGDLPKRTI